MNFQKFLKPRESEDGAHASTGGAGSNHRATGRGGAPRPDPEAVQARLGALKLLVGDIVTDVENGSAGARRRWSGAGRPRRAPSRRRRRQAGAAAAGHPRARAPPAVREATAPTRRSSLTKLAQAAELVHAATLLHDDVLDDGRTRRGMPAARVLWGNAASVLGGDFLLDPRARDHSGYRARRRARRSARRSVGRMIDGEALQLQHRGRHDLDAGSYIDVVDGKTASLFAWCGRAGARLAGSADAIADSLGAYGLHLGRAFQIVDDVLDVEGDPHALGKSVLSDLREGKLTLPVLYALEREPALRALLDAMRRRRRRRRRSTLPRRCRAPAPRWRHASARSRRRRARWRRSTPCRIRRGPRRFAISRTSCARGWRDVPARLRAFIETLDGAGELVRIRRECDPRLEIAEIAARTMKLPGGGPALLFENPRGSRFPLAINAFGSRRRMALALGVRELEEHARALAELLGGARRRALRDKLKMLPKLAASPARCRSRRRTGAVPGGRRGSRRPYLTQLPILTCWPDDGGPFITLPIVITHDPETGARNCGMYRMQLLDARTTAMHWQAHKTGDAPLPQVQRARAERVPVAVVLGGDPALTYAATAPLPDGVDELMLAGFLRRRAVELVPCKTQPIEVPADADFVLEGYVDPTEAADRRGAVRRSHRLLHAARQVPRVPRHLRHAAARRDLSRDRRRPAADGGRVAGQGDRTAVPAALRMMLPELVDYNLPVEGVFHNMAIVAIDKQYPWHGRKIMHALWGMGQLMFTKCVVVVDKEVDVHDLAEVGVARAQQHRSQARRHDLRRTLRRARPCVVLRRLRRQDGHRRHRQVEGRGLRRAAGRRWRRWRPRSSRASIGCGASSASPKSKWTR